MLMCARNIHLEEPKKLPIKLLQGFHKRNQTCVEKMTGKLFQLLIRNYCANFATQLKISKIIYVQRAMSDSHPLCLLERNAVDVILRQLILIDFWLETLWIQVGIS